MTKIIKLEKIIIYPVKSCKGIEVDQCQVTKSGLELDRRFVIIDKDNKMITGRNFPKTVTIVPKIIQENDETIVELSYEGFETLKLTTDTNKIKQTTEGSLVKIWDNDVHAYYMGDEAASWVSKVLDTEAKIYMKGENVREPLNVELGHLEFVPNFNFADKYPFNFVSYSSIQNIQKELPSDELKNTVNETNFRPNLVFSGSDPHEEDRWAEVKVGDLKFEGAEPCSRCMFPNVNPENGVAHPTEPSKTMMKHRRVYPNISRFRSFMGAHFIHTNEGALKVGDLVTVLKEQDPAQV